MGGPLNFERYHWFHRQVHAGAHPNATTLARRFEISTKQAQRTIAFLRERIGVPLVYDPSRKGYRYTDGAFQLPPLVVSQDELVAVLTARSLLPAGAAGPVSKGIRSLERKLRIELGGTSMTEQRFDRILSSSWAGYAPAADAIFQSVLGALLEDDLLRLRYRPPGQTTTTERTVEPHHLRLYLGNWMLLAHCRLQDGWRTFALSRMVDAERLGQRFEPRPHEQWRPLVDGVYGAFHGEPRIRVVLRFSPARAPWIREQVWHPDQEQTRHPDGTLDLAFPVADLPEVTLKVLSFGADVRVLEPPELRQRVAEEIKKMWCNLSEDEKTGDMGR